MIVKKILIAALLAMSVCGPASAQTLPPPAPTCSGVPYVFTNTAGGISGSVVDALTTNANNAALTACINGLSVWGSNIPLLAGPTGPAGPTGSTGVAGPTGPTGPGGANGHGATTVSTAFTTNSGAGATVVVPVVDNFAYPVGLQVYISPPGGFPKQLGTITALTGSTSMTISVLTPSDGSATMPIGSVVAPLGQRGPSGFNGATGPAGPTGPPAITTFYNNGGAAQTVGHVYAAQGQGAFTVNGPCAQNVSCVTTHIQIAPTGTNLFSGALNNAPCLVTFSYSGHIDSSNRYILYQSDVGQSDPAHPGQSWILFNTYNTSAFTVASNDPVSILYNYHCEFLYT